MTYKVIDNFYSNPEEIVRKATCDQPSPCPGSRSLRLDITDKDYYNSFKKLIYDIHGIEDREGLSFTTYFNLIPYNPIEILNYNWPHIDGDVRYGDTTLNHTNYEQRMFLSGQIFLSHIVDDDLAVRFWKEKPELNWSKEELFDKVLFNYLTTRDKYENGLMTLEEYEKKYELFHSYFYLDTKIDNVYNRMVSWKSGMIRGGIMVSEKQGYKLSQNFYVHMRANYGS
jgi:hypothetical protein